MSLTGIANNATCGKPAGCSDADVTTITADRPWGPNNPRFQLYAYGPVADLVPTDTISSPFYVVVLVGDDPSETDGDPLHDGSSAANPGSGVLTIRAESFGPRGVHRVVEATVARTAAVGHRARVRGAARAGRAEPPRPEGGRADARARRFRHRS